MADDVCVLVPTLDEAETVGDVVSGFHDEGYENVVVVDGGSTDGTRDVAEREGARVIVQSGRGKGQALREGIELTDAPYILYLDGDGTYDPADADRMLEPLRGGRTEHVIGNRFADMREGAMPRMNRVGNRLINAAFRYIHGRDLGDILSGYRAFTRDSYERLSLDEDGFVIETELAVECVKRRVSTAVVPVTYHPRPDQSQTNLSPFRDGTRIVVALYRLARMNNPLFYFGTVGAFSTLIGVGIGLWVGYEWFIREPPISHEAFAVVAAFFILFGFQLFMFGFLSDIVIAVNREQSRRLDELTASIPGDDPAFAPPFGHHRTEDDSPGDGTPAGSTGSTGSTAEDASGADRNTATGEPGTGSGSGSGSDAESGSGPDSDSDAGADDPVPSTADSPQED